MEKKGSEGEGNANGRLGCAECNFRTNSFKRLFKHKIQIHSNKTSSRCNICGKYWIDGLALKHHMNSHRPSLNQVKKTHFAESEKQDHMNDHGTDANIKGGMAQNYKQFKEYHKKYQDNSGNQNQLQIHGQPMKKAELDINTFECKDCGKKFNHEIDLRTHMKRAENRAELDINTFECKDCGKIFNHEIHLRAHIEVGKISTLDSSDFDTFTPFITHLTRSEAEKNSTLRKPIRHLPFECKFCNRRFLTKIHIIKHIDTHVRKACCKKKFKKHIRKPCKKTNTNLFLVGKNSTHESADNDTIETLEVEKNSTEEGAYMNSHSLNQVKKTHFAESEKQDHMNDHGTDANIKGGMAQNYKQFKEYHKKYQDNSGNQNQLQIHGQPVKKAELDINTFECKDCGKKFSHEKHLRAHIEVGKNSTLDSCDSDTITEPGKDKLFVSGLPQNITEEEIRSLFEIFGEIKNVRMFMKKDVFNFEGKCLLHFVDEELASDVKETIDQFEIIPGRKITLEYFM